MKLRQIHPLAKDRAIALERRKSQREKKQEKRKIQRTIVTKVNEGFVEKATITLLTEGESKRRYHRKRLAQSFSTPELSLKRQASTHPISKLFPGWDTANLETTLRSWPPGTPINWSAVAREHNVPGGNAGQVVKEFAAEKGIITSDIPSSTPRRQIITRS